MKAIAAIAAIAATVTTITYGDMTELQKMENPNSEYRFAHKSPVEAEIISCRRRFFETLKNIPEGAEIEKTEVRCEVREARAFVRPPSSIIPTVVPTVTSPVTGRIWMDRNVGASQVCTSRATTSCYGELYQWGRAKDGHEIHPHPTKKPSVTSQLASSINQTSSSFITSDSGEDWVVSTADGNGAKRTEAWKNGGVNNICPQDFSVPTEAELRADIVDVIKNAGKEFYSSTAMEHFLKLPPSGYRRYYDSELEGDWGAAGSYWSRTADISQTQRSRYLYFSGSGSDSGISSTYRTFGYSVRCIKDL